MPLFIGKAGFNIKKASHIKPVARCIGDAGAKNHIATTFAINWNIGRGGLIETRQKLTIS